MFPRQRRIAGGDFKIAKTSSKRASSAHITVAANNTGEGVAVIVSKKTAKLSVSRHKIKRRIIGALKFLEKSGTTLPTTLVIYVRKSQGRDVSYSEYKNELTEILAKFVSNNKKQS